jgi:hypothetical protein
MLEPANWNLHIITIRWNTRARKERKAGAVIDDRNDGIKATSTQLVSYPSFLCLRGKTAGRLALLRSFYGQVGCKRVILLIEKTEEKEKKDLLGCLLSFERKRLGLPAVQSITKC